LKFSSRFPIPPGPDPHRFSEPGDSRPVQARMEMLGLLRCAGELSAIAPSTARRAGSVTPRKTPKPPRVLTPLRRSGRLTAAVTPARSGSGRRCSPRLNGGLEHLPYRGWPPSLVSAPHALLSHGPGCH
jgi:hypothetical protein